MKINNLLISFNSRSDNLDKVLDVHYPYSNCWSDSVRLFGNKHIVVEELDYNPTDDVGPYIARSSREGQPINHIGFLIRTKNVENIVEKIKKNEDLLDLLQNKTMYGIGFTNTIKERYFNDIALLFGFEYIERTRSVNLYNTGKIKYDGTEKYSKEIINTDKLYYSSKNFILDVIKIKTVPHSWIYDLRLTIGITSLGKIIVFCHNDDIKFNESFIKILEEDIKKFIKKLYESSIFEGLMFKFFKNL